MTSWCRRGFNYLVYRQLYANVMVVTTILFAHTTFLWATCCLICFIPIVKPFLTHWSWLRFVLFIWSGNRARYGCGRWTGDAYSSMAPDPSRGPCKPGFYCGLFHYLKWTLILTADFSVYLTRPSDFDSGLFRLPNLDTLVLTKYWFLRLTWGARQVQPVGRGCLLLYGTWSHLWYIQRSVYAHSLICISYTTYAIDNCSLFFVISSMWHAIMKREGNTSSLFTTHDNALVFSLKMHTFVVFLCIYLYIFCLFIAAWAIFQISGGCHHYQWPGC
jgi:hypothetical protein